jgi:hypothetical protein
LALVRHRNLNRHKSQLRPAHHCSALASHQSHQRHKRQLRIAHRNLVLVSHKERRRRRKRRQRPQASSTLHRRLPRPTISSPGFKNQQAHPRLTSVVCSVRRKAKRVPRRRLRNLLPHPCSRHLKHQRRTCSAASAHHSLLRQQTTNRQRQEECSPSSPSQVLALISRRLGQTTPRKHPHHRSLKQQRHKRLLLSNILPALTLTPLPASLALQTAAQASSARRSPLPCPPPSSPRPQMSRPLPNCQRLVNLAFRKTGSSMISPLRKILRSLSITSYSWASNLRL